MRINGWYGLYNLPAQGENYSLNNPSNLSIFERHYESNPIALA
jgi:hypothetical protein